MTKIAQKFEITVWFRFVIFGNQEKDYQIHEIEAEDLQQAVNKASDLYRMQSAIPFKFLYNRISYSPTILTKEQMFNLTNPSV